MARNPFPMERNYLLKVNICLLFIQIFELKTLNKFPAVNVAKTGYDRDADVGGGMLPERDGVSREEPSCGKSSGWSKGKEVCLKTAPPP